MEDKIQAGMWIWIIFWIMLFLAIMVHDITEAWRLTPTDWSIQIMMDDNTKEVFYLLNETGTFN